MQSNDVIVVGAGIIGIACAHYLQQSGHRVTVIDQGKIGSGCSHANCGYICPSHVLPLTEPGAVATGLKSMLNPRAAFRVKPQARLALYEWMWQFARRCNRKQMIEAGHGLQALLEYSAKEFESLLDGNTLDCEWKKDGLIYVFQTPAGLAEFAEHETLIREHYGVHARFIDGADLPDVDDALKPGLAGAWLYEDDGFLRPDKLVSEWSSFSKERGIRYVEDCRLENIEATDGKVTGIITSQGKMAADHYVIATGAWSGKLGAMLGCKLPVEPGKGYSITMTPPANPPRYPMLLPEHRVGVTPFDEGYRLGSMMEFSGYDTSIPEFRVSQLQDSARPYLLDPVGDAIVERWYGWRPMTWDSLPIIGRAPGLSNTVLATGHNMLGLSMAPGTGRLVNDIICESPPAISVAPYSPERF